MTLEPTHQPTNTFVNYYALRVTTPHADSDRLWTVFSKYSHNFLYCKHNAHAGVDEGAEHFHCMFVDLTPSTVEKLRIALKREFKRGGNGFMSGKMMDNTVYKAIQYFRHDAAAEATFRHRGVHWNDVIEASPEWEERLSEKKVVSTAQDLRKSDPVLTVTNVVRQAVRWAHEHEIKTTSLSVVLEHMTRTSGWVPDSRLRCGGLDKLHYQMFEYRMKGRQGPVPNWWDRPERNGNFNFIPPT